MTIARLRLDHFRNHAAFDCTPAAAGVAITGPNGAGKTNILEAISLLGPGRGLRGAAIADMGLRLPAGGNGAPDGPLAHRFAVSADLGGDQAGVRIGTGTLPDAPDRRSARINGAPVSLAALGERIAMLWITPAMDRLFLDAPGARRRFVDRLVQAVDPRHARAVAQHDAALAERNRLLAMPGGGDAAWLGAVEARIAEHGAAMAEGRRALVAALDARLAATAADDFPRAALAIEGDRPDLDIARDLAAGRGRDRAAGRTLGGVHRIDLAVVDRRTGQAARLASTGEQKALLIGIMLAMAGLVTEARGAPPLLLLDEVAAHLDPDRRARLFARVADTGCQAWMTGTDPMLFDALGPAATRLALGGAEDFVNQMS